MRSPGALGSPGSARQRTLSTLQACSTRFVAFCVRRQRRNVEYARRGVAKPSRAIFDRTLRLVILCMNDSRKNARTRRA